MKYNHGAINSGNNIFSAATGALGAFGGMGQQPVNQGGASGGLGGMFGDDDDNKDLTDLEMEMMGGAETNATGLGQSHGIKIKVFINMSEDDENL